MQNGCVRTKKDRVRLRVCRRTAASEHRRSYAITMYPTTNVSATQGLLRNWLFWFVSFIWLTQTNRKNQMSQTVRYRRCSRPWGVVRS